MGGVCISFCYLGAYGSVLSIFCFGYFHDYNDDNEIVDVEPGLNLHGSSRELSSHTSFFFNEFLYFRGNSRELINVELRSSLVWNSSVIINIFLFSTTDIYRYL